MLDELPCLPAPLRLASPAAHNPNEGLTGGAVYKPGMHRPCLTTGAPETP